MSHLWPVRRTLRAKQRPVLPPPTVETILLALRDGPLSVSELSPPDPVAIWGGPIQKALARETALPALLEAETQGLVVSFRRGGPSGHLLWKLTDKGATVVRRKTPKPRP